MAEQRRTERNRGWRAACAASLLLLVACSDGDDRAASQTTETTSGSNAESDAGTIEDTVTTSPELVVEPVAIGEVGAFGDGVTTRVTNVEAVEAEAFMPGEMSGPALAVTIEISNGTAAPVELDSVIIDLVGPGDRYATLITPDEPTALAGTVAPDATSEGTYVFSIPVDDRDDVAVRVSYTPMEPTVVFEGSLADA